MIGKTEISTPGARIVILNRKEQVLLEERSDFKIWGLPGGTADPGEDIIVKHPQSNTVRIFFLS